MPDRPPQTVAETAHYLRRAERLLDQAEREEVVLIVASQPTLGDLIVGTGGIRKFRYGPKGRGKSGGVRVIYFFYNETMPIYLLTVFGKNEKANLSQAERNQLRRLTEELVQAHKGGTRGKEHLR